MDFSYVLSVRFCLLIHANSSLCANNRVDSFASSSDLQVQQMSARHINGAMPHKLQLLSMMLPTLMLFSLLHGG